MQDYIDLAAKNGIVLLDSGNCQLCGAPIPGGIHACVALFNMGFEQLDYSQRGNYRYRFLSVDAHTLQHPEIHGRWNNHFHLTRLHLVFYYGVTWDYSISPLLSSFLNTYKASRTEEYLMPPPIGARGALNTAIFIDQSRDASACRALVEAWAQGVYQAWETHHGTVDHLARNFLDENKNISCTTTAGK